MSSDKTIFGSSSSSLHIQEDYRKCLVSHDLDHEDLEFLTGHISSQSASGYSYAFAKFKTFCLNIDVDPFTFNSPAYIVKFLRKKFDSGDSYRTICYYRSAISKFHAGLGGGENIGQHQLVKQAVKAAFRGRPPLPKYKRTYDISPVLTYIASLEPLHTLSLKQLTFKSLFLLSFASLSRVSSLGRLKCNIEETQVVCTAYDIIIYFICLSPG